MSDPATYTTLTKEQFAELLEYSASLPTGTSIGKRWKRRVPARGEPCEWFMGEYVEPTEKDRAEAAARGTECVGIRWTKIAVAGQTLLVNHLHRQVAFSLRTFGPGVRTRGVLDHILKELVEIEAAPLDLEEWIDVAILAFDGALRTGASPEAIVHAMLAKQAKNEARVWPDWRTADPNKAIEHVRTEASPA